MEHHILLIDDEPLLIRVMAKMLEGLGQVRFATSGEAGLKIAREWRPDVVLLDVDMPGKNGYQTCEAFKQDPALHDVPVIFVTSYNDRDFEVEALEIGAADFLVKPVNEASALARVKSQLRLKRRSDQLRSAATKDLLTQLPNDIGFGETLPREWTRGLRSGSPISLLTLSIDHFDQYQETYGQSLSDRSLRRVAEALESVRKHPADVLARVDHATFSLLLLETRHEEAIARAHQALQAIELQAIANASSPICAHLTASAGIAVYDETSCWWRPLPAEGGPVTAPGGTALDLARCSSIALEAARARGGAQACWSSFVPASETVLCHEALPGAIVEPHRAELA